MDHWNWSIELQDQLWEQWATGPGPSDHRTWSIEPPDQVHCSDWTTGRVNRTRYIGPPDQVHCSDWTTGPGPLDHRTRSILWLDNRTRSIGLPDHVHCSDWTTGPSQPLNQVPSKHYRTTGPGPWTTGTSQFIEPLKKIPLNRSPPTVTFFCTNKGGKGMKDKQNQSWYYLQISPVKEDFSAGPVVQSNQLW